MSDSETTANAAPGIEIIAQYVKDLSFENPNAPRALTMKAAPDVAVNVNAEARPVGEELYELMLHLKAEAKHDAQTAFIVELAYGAIFRLAGTARDAAASRLLVEGAPLLFPFARFILSEVTRQGGFPPLLINPIDFARLYREGGKSPQPSSQEGGA